MIKIFKSKIFLPILITSFILIYMLIISNNKGFIIVNNQSIKKKDNENSTVFSDVKYKFSDEKGKNYYVNGGKAHINKKNLNLIKLESVNAFTYLNDGSILKITSDKGEFSKKDKNIFFNQNIIVVNKDIIIYANKAQFLFSNNTIEVFEDVILKNFNNTIKCDSLIYEMNTNNINLKMNSDKKQIYGKKHK